MQKYSKFIVAIIGAVVAGLYSYYGETSTVYQTAVALATALGVYVVRNK